MDNFKLQVQSIKSQIDNIKLQISNIELQYNNMMGINQGEQLLNISIQILNTGIQAFNSGKSQTMSSIDNYYNQLKNISNLINTILDDYTNMSMQQQMMQQAMMQQQMMQRQIIDDLNRGEPEIINKMNITFEESSGFRINLIVDYGTKIKDVLEKFSTKIGVPKFNFYFLFNGESLNYDDERKIEEHLLDRANINAVRIK